MQRSIFVAKVTFLAKPGYRPSPKGRGRMATTVATKPSFWAKAGKFLKETWGELKKTSWPSWDEIKKNTLLVLAASIIITIYVGGLDFLFGFITRKLGM
jgi:preprotein translocase subunit SecE